VAVRYGRPEVRKSPAGLPACLRRGKEFAILHGVRLPCFDIAVRILSLRTQDDTGSGFGQSSMSVNDSDTE
jgi:hypothetical protein